METKIPHESSERVPLPRTHNVPKPQPLPRIPAELTQLPVSHSERKSSPRITVEHHGFPHPWRPDSGHMSIDLPMDKNDVRNELIKMYETMGTNKRFTLPNILKNQVNLKKIYKFINE